MFKCGYDDSLAGERDKNMIYSLSFHFPRFLHILLAMLAMLRSPQATSVPFDPLNPFISLSVDNYLATDVACTLACPRANQEVIITHPGGNETQRCDDAKKCEGDCPKGGITVQINGI